MIENRRDYNEVIAVLCRKHNVKYLALHGSSYDQDNICGEEPEITFLVEFFPMEPKEHAMCYLGLEKKLGELFGREVGLCDLTGITLPDILRPLTRRKTDIYKAMEPPMQN